MRTYLVFKHTGGEEPCAEGSEWVCVGAMQPACDDIEHAALLAVRNQPPGYDLDIGDTILLVDSHPQASVAFTLTNDPPTPAYRPELN